jgi:ketosteroid isomerase-like protein
MLAGLGVRPAFANPTPKKHDTKRQVEHLEEQWRVAQLAGDTGTMDKMLSDDYIGISMTGEVDTKAQHLHRVIDRRLMLTKLELSDMKVKLVGAVAIVTSRAQVEGDIDGKPMKGMFWYTRIYQHLPSGEWKITSFEATREHRHRSDVDGEAPDANVPLSTGKTE